MGRNKKKKSDKKPQVQQCLEESENDTLSYDNTKIQENTSDSSEKPIKRLHDNESSDANEVPEKRKKKKKGPAIPEESTGKKNKKSIRQLKREKLAAKIALDQAHAKDQTKSQCLNYLSQWKHDRQNWKFMKARQVWLHKNKFSTLLVPDESWPILLEYFEAAKGNIKTTLLNDANKIIKQMDDWTDSQNKNDPDCDEGQTNATEVEKPNETVYSRARSLIQCLQE